MKTTLKLEELALFIFSIFLFNQLEIEWWWYLLLILTPDIGMLGYLINPKLGALSYNLFHHKGIAILFILIGWKMEFQVINIAGIILLGHTSLDRIFGYGLKYIDSFKNTHLGKLI
mgnify:CR=1 FL=1